MMPKLEDKLSGNDLTISSEVKTSQPYLAVRAPSARAQNMPEIRALGDLASKLGVVVNRDIAPAIGDIQKQVVLEAVDAFRAGGQTKEDLSAQHPLFRIAVNRGIDEQSGRNAIAPGLANVTTALDRIGADNLNDPVSQSAAIIEKIRSEGEVSNLGEDGTRLYMSAMLAELPRLIELANTSGREAAIAERLNKIPINITSLGVAGGGLLDDDGGPVSPDTPQSESLYNSVHTIISSEGNLINGTEPSYTHDPAKVSNAVSLGLLSLVSQEAQGSEARSGRLKLIEDFITLDAQRPDDPDTKAGDGPLLQAEGIRRIETFVEIEEAASIRIQQAKIALRTATHREDLRDASVELQEAIDAGESPEAIAALRAAYSVNFPLDTFVARAPNPSLIAEAGSWATLQVFGDSEYKDFESVVKEQFPGLRETDIVKLWKDNNSIREQDEDIKSYPEVQSTLKQLDFEIAARVYPMSAVGGSGGKYNDLVGIPTAAVQAVEDRESGSNSNSTVKLHPVVASAVEAIQSAYRGGLIRALRGVPENERANVIKSYTDENNHKAATLATTIQGEHADGNGVATTVSQHAFGMPSPSSQPRETQSLIPPALTDYTRGPLGAEEIRKRTKAITLTPHARSEQDRLYRAHWPNNYYELDDSHRAKYNDLLGQSPDPSGVAPFMAARVLDMQVGANMAANRAALNVEEAARVASLPPEVELFTREQMVEFAERDKGRAYTQEELGAQMRWNTFESGLKTAGSFVGDLIQSGGPAQFLFEQIYGKYAPEPKPERSPSQLPDTADDTTGDTPDQPSGWNRRFPTDNHPIVARLDGAPGGSNVVLKGFTFEVGGIEKEYLIPTMVGGKQLSDEQAVEIAQTHGIHRYPSFPVGGAASAWAQRNHDKIDERGRWNPERAALSESGKLMGAIGRRIIELEKVGDYPAIKRILTSASSSLGATKNLTREHQEALKEMANNNPRLFNARNSERVWTQIQGVDELIKSIYGSGAWAGPKGAARSAEDTGSYTKLNHERNSQRFLFMAQRLPPQHLLAVLEGTDRAAILQAYQWGRDHRYDDEPLTMDELPLGATPELFKYMTDHPSESIPEAMKHFENQNKNKVLDDASSLAPVSMFNEHEALSMGVG